MLAYKDKEKGTWYASFYYEDWTGKKVKKMKRGFPAKREALEWERTFLQQQTADLDMTFENFVAVYVADMKGRIKENTWGTKEHIIYKKLVPYFGKRKMCDIHSKEVMAWQNEMLNHKGKDGKPYSPVYLKTLHNQLSAIFNHAVRHYNLKVNPAAQVENQERRLKELALAVKNLERLAAKFSADPEDILPEAGTLESAKAYREKKAKPLLAKIAQVLRSLYRAYIDLKGKYERLQGDYGRVRESNERLSDRLQEVKMENKARRGVSADYERVKRAFGSKDVEAVVAASKQQEQEDRGQRRSTRQKTRLDTR